MPISKLRPSFSFTEDRLRELQAVVPEAFADGKINWDTLREALGEHLEDESQEHFGLFWPGKREARRLAAMPSKGTLIPQPGEGVDEENTHNIFIEGDNLEVLKLLQKSYAGRVKMIYIDPPYNTGNDFVYPDDYSEPLEAYLERTGQVDETGQLLTTNSRASGRFHSNWMSMIYPRLLLARQLLSDEGLIFVSIDDTEAHHLRSIMDELFGEENFVANIAWEKRFTRSNNARMFYSLKDTILLYKGESVSFLREQRTEKSDSIYSNPDNDPRGAWTSASYVNPATKAQRPNLVYTIINPKTKEKINHPTHAWKYEQAEHMRHQSENRLWWGANGDAKLPRLKIFLSESEGLVPIDLWDYETSGTTDEGGAQLKELFGESVFDNPKPTKLIKRMLQVSKVNTGDIVLDFFGGSGSTAHAIYEYNSEQEKSANFIVVQMSEPTPVNSLARKSGYKTIDQISRERIRRIVKKLRNEKKGEMKLGIDQDYGFSSFELVNSHFKDWEPFSGKDTSQLELRLSQAETPLVEGWTPENLLVEILLLQGFPLDSRVKTLPEFKANEVKQVTSEFVAHHLYVCLDQKIKAETVKNLRLRAEDIFVCLDSALSDEAKVNLADRCNLKVI